MKKYTTVGQLTDYLSTQMIKKDIRTYDTNVLLLVNSLQLSQVNEFELSGKIYGIEQIVEECFKRPVPSMGEFSENAVVD